ncbi:MAG: hypothetical protein HLUCCA24_00160, partial [Rhodobacteraceae bacterium HLUCCA24]
LDRGRFFYYGRVQRAIEHHENLMKGRLPPWMRRGQPSQRGAS